jgi:hypothetical protein
VETDIQLPEYSGNMEIELAGLLPVTAVASLMRMPSAMMKSTGSNSPSTESTSSMLRLRTCLLIVSIGLMIHP